MAIRPFSFSGMLRPGGSPIIAIPVNCPLEMLAANCDLDDMVHLQNFINILNQLSLVAEIRVERYKNSDTNDYVPYYKVLNRN